LVLSFLGKLCVEDLKFLIIFENLFLEFNLSFDELVLSQDVVVNKFFNLNITVAILVTLAKEFVNNLTAMVLVNTLLCQKHHHFIFIYIAITVKIDLSKFLVEFSFFFCF
jgi:hypothetical protein